MKIPILAIFLCFFLVQSNISFENLKVFWEATYDTDKDGQSTLADFVSFFRIMEPQLDVTQEDVIEIFKFFDADQNKKVTLKELMQVASVKPHYKPGHKQIHLGLTNQDGEMQVMWVSNPQHYNKPVVHYGKLPGLLNQKVQGTFTTYNAGHIGFHGRIYKAVMKNLTPLKRYYYKVGDQETNTFSSIRFFKAPPLKVQYLYPLRFAVFGDMGTFAPFGSFVIDQIAKDNFIKPLDLVFLTGDISYAGMNSQKVGETQPIWDLYGELTQKFTAYVPFMPGVGNHQKYYNYTSYQHRYHLPRHSSQQTNLWFSFDYAQVHFVHFSSEHPYNLASAQFNFLEEDLKAARSNPLIKWVILADHRPFYSSSTYQHQNQTNLAKELQDLANKYHVDIVQTGHVHSYQRSWPTYKGKAMKQRANLTHYIEPQHPVYVVQGTSGAFMKQKWVNPQPEWSARKFSHYGYGRITIRGDQLKYQYISIPTGRVVDEWHIIKKGWSTQKTQEVM